MPGSFLFRMQGHVLPHHFPHLLDFYIGKLWISGDENNLLPSRYRYGRLARCIRSHNDRQSVATRRIKTRPVHLADQFDRSRQRMSKRVRAHINTGRYVTLAPSFGSQALLARSRISSLDRIHLRTIMHGSKTAMLSHFFDFFDVVFEDGASDQEAPTDRAQP
ncbi:MAG: hypothetical protein MK108_10280 [Mariniblastus sp.]|nr:hypothetical protein [Mariniblastus sp.]